MIVDHYKQYVTWILPVFLMHSAKLTKILATVLVMTDLLNMTHLLRSTEWLTIPLASSKQHAIDIKKRWQAATAVCMPIVMKVQGVRSAIVKTALSTGATVLAVSGIVSKNIKFPIFFNNFGHHWKGMIHVSESHVLRAVATVSMTLELRNAYAATTPMHMF